MNIFDPTKDNGFIKIIGEQPAKSRFSHRSDLQKEPITENTKFLYYIYKDEVGYHSDWAWSEKPNDLVDFLLDYLLARAMFKEINTDESNSDGLETHSLQESLLLALVDAVKNRNIDPEYWSDFNNALSEFMKAAEKGDDLNLASQNLMDFTSGLFYSLTWTFYGGLDETKDALKSHNIIVQNDNIADSLLSDKSI
ncbi:MAG: hypothetical protein K6G74_02515 [Bacilli bacterium]|nr:hypothetical protein [Bacilli bacterium]